MHIQCNIACPARPCSINMLREQYHLHHLRKMHSQVKQKLTHCGATQIETNALTITALLTRKAFLVQPFAHRVRRGDQSVEPAVRASRGPFQWTPSHKGVSIAVDEEDREGTHRSILRPTCSPPCSAPIPDTPRITTRVLQLGSALSCLRTMAHQVQQSPLTTGCLLINTA